MQVDAIKQPVTNAWAGVDVSAHTCDLHGRLRCCGDRRNTAVKIGVVLPDRAHARLGYVEHTSGLGRLHMGQRLRALPNAQSLVVTG